MAALIVFLIFCALFVGAMGFRRIGIPALVPAIALVVLLIALALSDKL